MGHSAATLDAARGRLRDRRIIDDAPLQRDEWHRSPRSPGLALAALVDDDAYVELIADGVHVHPALWRLIARTKPTDRLMLISDAIPIAGMGDGRATVGGLDIDVTGDR